MATGGATVRRAMHSRGSCARRSQQTGPRSSGTCKMNHPILSSQSRWRHSTQSSGAITAIAGQWWHSRPGAPSVKPAACFRELWSNKYMSVQPTDEQAIIPTVEDIATEVANILGRRLEAKDLVRLLQIVFLDVEETAELLRVKPATVST